MKFPAMLSRARGNPAVAGVSTALMAILLLVGIAALVAASWYAAGRVHEREIGDRNAEMAQLVLNTTRDAVDELLAADLERPPGTGHFQRMEQARAALDAAIVLISQDIPILKIKIYAPNGLTVYSTDFNEIGIDHSGNEGVIEALRGGVVNERIRERQLNVSDGIVETHHQLESYIPIVGAGGIVGVFELYRGLTESRAIFDSLDPVALLLLLGIVVVGSLLTAGYRWQQSVHAGLVAGLAQKAADAKRETEELREQRSADAALPVDSVLDGIRLPTRIIDLDFNVLHANAAVGRIAGTNPSSATGRRCYAALYGAEAPCRDEDDRHCPLRDALQADATIAVTHDTPRGRTRLTVSPLHDQGGRIIAFVETIEPTTSR